MAGSDTSSESEYYDLDDDGQLEPDDEQMLTDGWGECNGPNDDDELGNIITYDIEEYFSKDEEKDRHIPYDYNDNDDDEEEHHHIQAGEYRTLSSYAKWFMIGRRGFATQATKFVNSLNEQELVRSGNADEVASSSSSSSPSANNNKAQVVSAPVGIPRLYIRFLSSARSKAARYPCGAVKKLLKRNFGKQINMKIQKHSIGLFYEFLKYYGWEYEYSKKRVISVRTGRVLDTLSPDLSSSKKKQCFLIIEDPFQLDRNIGATLFSHARLQVEFRRAVNILSDVALKGNSGTGAAFISVFEEIYKF
ncbi:hypothetical protein HDU76_004559 [Blyttiomyces sp. JEL0837]|nr:hypothetical protein HDU76_004559 [Blyttiomyces sp. JEL0837]